LSRDQYERVPETEIFHHPGIHLKRLTNALCVADFDPVYLPDGTIVFASTRDPKYNMCSRDIAADLFRMNGDGSNIYQITKSTLFEHNPTLLPDGRICYHRWEYVDRDFGDAHALWTVSPDGLNQSVYWGNNTAVPGGIYNPNFIEETGEMLCIFGPHHALENGALAIIDRRLGIDGPDPVVQTWPESFKLLVRDTGGFDCDTSVTQVPLKFEDPLVLDESHFLVSRMIVPNGKTGLYLVDRNYHEFLLREEPTERGIYDSRLVRPRKKPFIVKGNRDFENNDGTFYVSNVYIGTHMKSVKPGSARYLRVVQSPEKRNFSWGSWEGQGYTAPGMNWHSLENKKILGTVRIEEDGSTAFKVPCDKFVYFQLLDEKGKMLQTMRSGTVLQSGEKTSCIGCHENRLETTANSTAEQITVAMTKEPQSLTLRPGEPGSEFSYMRDIQPIFDKHCVECHDYGKPAGEKLNLAPDRDLVFNTSYVNLWNSSYIRCIGAGPAELQESLTWGSNVSPLIQEIENPRVKEHIDVKLNEKLTAEEMTRLCTWIDLNGVYYPCYESAWPDSNSGRTPYSRAELEELGGYLGVTFDYAR
ncbi:MAG: PD40 domain-containing protein, partial [Thermoguttaceae bacterium]|nr:PD40 domain-containing protein [Thermoguttaceae bacterium]